MYKEFCKLYWTEVQSECIKHNWYTLGTSAQYRKLQEYVLNNADEGHNLATENYMEVLQHIAEDILWHSDTEYPVEDIMTCLGMRCIRYFDIC